MSETVTLRGHSILTKDYPLPNPKTTDLTVLRDKIIESSFEPVFDSLAKRFDSIRLMR